MKKQRTKCFTGCWTCRSRRVKCDEETPLCQRCRQMGIACEGYGVRLNWVHYNPHDATDYDDSPSKPEPKMFRRALTSLGVFPSLPCLPSQELDATLTTIDGWCPGDSSKLEDGAFSVFPLSHLSETVKSPAQISPRSYEATATPNFPGDSYALSTTSQDGDDAYGAVDNSINESCGNSVPAAQTLLSLGGRDRHSPPRHLDALSMPSKQKRLIHHWITFTSRKLVLIDEPHNPCRTMMLPMALKGLVSQSKGSNADVAIFHAICAAAAYNLFELTDQANDQDRVLALYHDNEAVHHLRHNLARADEHRDQSFAMAIMACIAVEAVSGTTQRWRTHVSGGLAYLAKLQSQGLDEAALSAFRQHMVKMAILCDFSVPNHFKSFLYDESGSSDGLEFTFPYYGVSRSFLRAHDHINALLASESTVRTPAQEQELDAFELQIYLDFPGLPPCSLLSAVANKTHGVVVHHTSKAFYYANLVYLQRSVRCAPVTAVQDLVDLGVQELESIDRVGQGALGCLMLWPVLILGAECDGPDVQNRMRDWFRAQRRLGFRNLAVLEDLVATVWESRANPTSNKSDGDWRQVIAQAQFDVFRL
ncbi:sequence-specific DNA binding RNA polymerase II transcription factor [Ascochyta rabiei]|uniref:Sequence-specific DNA binding RNA polymerase II transcription factor n=1 Tax=Didymella rabiei TaxID=5454 RepID=A0A162X4C7_DIDRA|nr:sequence-specific DNA binding RNA polymerase II transcription factor [Ascochyta rabiei]